MSTSRGGVRMIARLLAWLLAPLYDRMDRTRRALTDDRTDR